MKKLAVAALVLSSLSGGAYAHEAGEFFIRAGSATARPTEGSDNVLGMGGFNVSNNTQLGLTFTYMATDNIGIELLAATPFSHSVGVKGMPGPFAGLNGKLADIKHLPPTLSAVYYPLDSSSAFQPYVGLGLNYTWFFDTELTSAAEGKGFSGFDLDDSWGLAGQVGMDYMLTDNLLFNAHVRYIDIETTGTTSFGGREVKVDVDVDPWVYMVALGYKF